MNGYDTCMICHKTEPRHEGYNSYGRPVKEGFACYPVFDEKGKNLEWACLACSEKRADNLQKSHKDFYRQACWPVHDNYKTLSTYPLCTCGHRHSLHVMPHSFCTAPVHYFTKICSCREYNPQ